MPAVLYGTSKDLVSRVLHVQVLDVTEPTEASKEALPDVKQINVVTVSSDKPSHSRNFETILWKGSMYKLRPRERPIVKLLWEAWKTPHKFISGADLLESSGTCMNRMVDVFKGGEVWMTVVVPGEKRGGPPDTYCLND